MPGGSPEILAAIAALEVKIDTLQVAIDTEKSVQRICAHCGGDGIKGNPDGGVSNCPDCGGDGHRPFGRITKKTEE